MKVGISPTAKFGQEMVARMDALHLSVRELARRAQTSYEHIRKIIHGSAFPSKYLLRSLCDLLRLDLPEMERMLVAERIKRKYGVVTEEPARNDSGLQTLEDRWRLLTPAQQADVLATLEDLVRRNGKEGAA
jgi:transcriptional regulator with XRE-family HTH domain